MSLFWTEEHLRSSDIHVNDRVGCWNSYMYRSLYIYFEQKLWLNSLWTWAVDKEKVTQKTAAPIHHSAFISS